MRLFLKAAQPKFMQSRFRSAGEMMDYSRYKDKLTRIELPVWIDKFPVVPEDSKLLCIFDKFGNKGREEVHVCEDLKDIHQLMNRFNKDQYAADMYFMLAKKECFLEEAIMSREELSALMNSSKSKKEWRDNCNKVRARFNGNLPSFWFSTVGTIDLETLPKPEKKSTDNTSNETNEDCKRKRM